MGTGGTRKADWVAADLMRRIVGGEAAAGTVLPREADLAVEFGVNRSVIREAVKQLEVHLLVKPTKRRGTEVLDPLRSPSADVLWAMLEPKPGVIERDALADLLEVRAVLDIEMSAVAAIRRDDGDLLAMDALVQQLGAAMGQSGRYAELMGELNLAMARATKNRIYVMLVHWHHRMRGDYDPLQQLVRLANEAHLSGVSFLVELVRQGEADQVRTFVAGVHDWLTPRVLAAADLSNGVPLAQAFESLQ